MPDMEVHGKRWRDAYVVSDIPRLVAVALFNAALAYVTIKLFSNGNIVSVFWPASGIALAALLLGGDKYLPAVFCGAWLGEWWGGSPAHFAAILACGATLESATILWLLKRERNFDLNMSTLPDFGRLIRAGSIGALLSALIGVGSLWSTHHFGSVGFPTTLLRWWMGNVLGILLVTPLIIVWRQVPDWRGRGTEITLILGITFLLDQIIFFGWFAALFQPLVRGYWIFLVVAWVAIRFGVHGVLAVLFLIAGQSLAGTYMGFGIFVTAMHESNMDAYWGFMVVLTLIGMTLATHFQTQRIAEQEILREREQQAALRELAEIALAHGPSEPVLLRMLDHLLAISWLSLMPKGGISLLGADGNLSLVVERNLPDALKPLCKLVHPGECHCGRAAQTHEIQFSRHVDTTHEISFPGMTNHGHYCIPLLRDDQVLGVLFLYLEANASRVPQRESFLQAAANIVAGYLARAQIEQSLASHQSQLEEKVRQRTNAHATSEARTRAVLRTMHDGVIQIDATGNILLANDAFCTLFGYTDEELIGQNVSVIMPEPYCSQHDGYLARYQQTHISKVIGHRNELSGRRKDDSTFPLELAVNELIDDAGVTFIGVLRDLTFQHEMEAVREMALQEAQQLAKTRSDFLANMSHEIRTPVSAMLGLARIGLRENQGRSSQANYARMLDAAQHLLGVINDILDFSKIEAGKFMIESHPLQLVKTIEEAASMVAERAAAKELTLECHPMPNLPAWVMGDALRIKQILVNLLSNAIKFTEHGRIVLMAGRDADDLWFSVRDEGIGMTQELIERLFRPFEQADSSTTRRFGGTGLGLSISMNLARLMDGNIDVVSAPGQGSTFTLHLPLAETTPPATAGSPDTLASVTEQRLAGLRVLAADDVEVNRFILEDLLIEAGASGIYVENGRQAVDRVTENPAAFDVVLMDVQMPEMDGHEATRRIRQIAPDLPVIGLTAHALAEERDKCLAAGMVDHVSKPIDTNELITAVLRHARPERVTITNTAAAPAPTFPGNADAAQGEIDWQVLQARYPNKPAFLRRLAQSVLDGHGETPDKLRQQAAAEDFAELAFLTHRTKGLAGNLAAATLQELAANAEQAANAKDHAGFSLALRLADRFQLLLDEIAVFLRQESDI